MCATYRVRGRPFQIETTKTLMMNLGLEVVLTLSLLHACLRGWRTNGTHQPPACCARLRGSRGATTSPLHHWPDATTGKCTPPKDATQAPRYSERGAVASRLHELVSRNAVLERWNGSLLRFAFIVSIFFNCFLAFFRERSKGFYEILCIQHCERIKIRLVIDLC